MMWESYKEPTPPCVVILLPPTWQEVIFLGHIYSLSMASPHPRRKGLIFRIVVSPKVSHLILCFPVYRAHGQGIKDQLFYQINIFQNCFTQRNKTPILVLYVWNSNMHMNKFCVGQKYARSRAAEKIITFSYSHLFCLAHIATDFWS